jgi:uncharacterized membrane protein YccC
MSIWRRDNLIFALNSFVAAMLALFIALWLGLPRPYWAMLTAYITTQPLAGAVRSKAVYRLAGTLIGAAMAVALVPNFVNQPLLLSFLLALWTGCCVAISVLDRTPRSYMMMLAGYTAALIGFPSVDHPEAIFDAAWARSVEIGLGVVCTAVVHSVLFPRPVGPVIGARLQDWLERADRALADIVAGLGEPELDHDRRALAAAASDIRILGAHLPFDTARAKDAEALIRAVHDRLLLLITQLAAIRDRLQALAPYGEGDPAVERLLADVGLWLKSGAAHSDAQVLAAALRDQAEGERTGDWRALLQESLLTHLAEAVETLGEAHALLDRFQRPDAPLSRDLETSVASAVRRPLHADYGLALRSGLTLVVSVMATSALWIFTGWPDGASAAAMAAVFCALFASLDDPAPVIIYFAVCSLLTLALGAVYNFGVFQAISGFPLLALALFPPLFLLAVPMGEARLTPKITPLIISFTNALNVQQAAPLDFAAYLNANLGVYAGVLVATFTIRALRSMTVQEGAQRLLRQTWRSVRRLAERRTGDDRAQVASLLVDRLALLAPRLSLHEPEGDAAAQGVVRDLGVAMDVMALRDVQAELPSHEAARIDQVMTSVQDIYADRMGQTAMSSAEDRLRQIDHALCGLAASPDRQRRSAALALVDLRRSLFPQAPEFTVQAEVAA